MIPVDRGARGKVMFDVLKRTREELATGRQLIIYPEGTRRPPGAEPVYKYGIARMYRDLNVPVVPVVMHPGPVLAAPHLPCAIPAISKCASCRRSTPGMDPDAFFARLMEETEKASDELLVETIANNPHLPVPPTAAQRLAEIAKAKVAAAV